MLRSKLEHEKSSKGKRQNEVKKCDVTTDSTAEMQSASASVSYIPPWFDRYVEYKFNLLDRAGQISQRQSHSREKSYRLSINRRSCVPAAVFLRFYIVRLVEMAAGA